MTTRRPPEDERRVALRQERTALAWDRTGLGLMVAGGLFVRAAGPPYTDVRHAPGVAAMVVGGALIVLAYRRYGRLRRSATPESGGSAGMVAAVGAVTVVFSFAALLLILVRG
ncbi:MAG: DUF202 domain-containing protein [Nitriliruptorales bacterium]|nr:DUF202 domain-containing protein [Nitriliruptorales bacterium]